MSLRMPCHHRDRSSRHVRTVHARLAQRGNANAARPQDSVRLPDRSRSSRCSGATPRSPLARATRRFASRPSLLPFPLPASTPSSHPSRTRVRGHASGQPGPADASSGTDTADSLSDIRMRPWNESEPEGAPGPSERAARDPPQREIESAVSRYLRSVPPLASSPVQGAPVHFGRGAPGPGACACACACSACGMIRASRARKIPSAPAPARLELGVRAQPAERGMRRRRPRLSSVYSQRARPSPIAIVGHRVRNYHRMHHAISGCAKPPAAADLSSSGRGSQPNFAAQPPPALCLSPKHFVASSKLCRLPRPTSPPVSAAASGSGLRWIQMAITGSIWFCGLIPSK